MVVSGWGPGGGGYLYRAGRVGGLGAHREIIPCAMHGRRAPCKTGRTQAAAMEVNQSRDTDITVMIFHAPCFCQNLSNRLSRVITSLAPLIKVGTSIAIRSGMVGAWRDRRSDVRVVYERGRVRLVSPVLSCPVSSVSLAVSNHAIATQHHPHRPVVEPERGWMSISPTVRRGAPPGVRLWIG